MVRRLEPSRLLSCELGDLAVPEASAFCSLYVLSLRSAEPPGVTWDVVTVLLGPSICFLLPCTEIELLASFNVERDRRYHHTFHSLSSPTS